MIGSLKAHYERAIDKLNQASWLGPALVRITIGVVFATTGWGKLHSLDDVTQFFTELQLPAPHFQAVLVASTEFIGGLALIVGVATRLAAFPLLITMVVAILTAKRSQIDGVASVLGFEEFSYLAMFLWLIVAGPGKLSIDHLIARRFAPKAAAYPRPLLAPNPSLVVPAMPPTHAAVATPHQ
jgi:putative oxidoreductase